MTVTTYTGRTLEFDLAQMTPDARASFLAVFQLGAEAGWHDGYRAAEEDLAAIQRRAYAVVQAAARTEPFDALAERRGEPARAARQRELLRDRGIAS